MIDWFVELWIDWLISRTMVQVIGWLLKWLVDWLINCFGWLVEWRIEGMSDWLRNGLLGCNVLVDWVIYWLFELYGLGLIGWANNGLNEWLVDLLKKMVEWISGLVDGLV